MKTRLLLVEDDEDDYIITRDLLEDMATGDYSLHWVQDLPGARQALAEDHYDVCLVDYRLGAEEGLVLLREAVSLGFSGPIIILTGQDSAELDAEAQLAGAVDYLVKSQLTPARLARAIRYAISRKEMEHERVERLRAESENRAKSEFLAHLSHELRTPLTAILGYTDLLLDSAGADPQRDGLRVIKRNGQHLLSLLNDVLDLSKIEAGKLEIEKAAVPLHGFLADVYKLMAIRAQDKGLDFSVHAPQALPEYVITDATRLRQILLNLLGNAIKFTDHGRVTLTVSHTLKDSREQLIFAVADTGIGIGHAELDKLFLPFSQTENVSSRLEKGTGLGLAISQKLAARLDGHIAVSSDPQQGSQFTLTITCAEACPGDKKAFSVHGHDIYLVEDAAAQLHGSVLVADDVAEIRNLIGYIVSRLGLRVSYANDGRDALEKVRAASANGCAYDLVILDMQMPELSGRDVARRLRTDGNHVPIIALTASTMKGEREASLAAGFNEHLSKPIDREKLIQCLQRFLPAALATDAVPVQGTLMLVEDDKDARDSTCQLLEMLGASVITAASASEALQKMQETAPNLFLVDVNLPDMNGFELAQQLRQRCQPDARIIALSGHGLTQQQLLASAFDAAYTKPVDLATLKLLSEFSHQRQSLS